MPPDRCLLYHLQTLETLMTINIHEHSFASGIRRSSNLMIALGALMILAGFAAIALS